MLFLRLLVSIITRIVFDDSARIFLGTHRIQRVSASEKNGRRHTSFVQVAEVIETHNKITIKDSDLRIDTFRATGPGGQHRNKTDSAVRILHVPSGTIVTATESRSQHQNRNVARKRLEAKFRGTKTITDIVPDQQWIWCEWRNEVTLPDGSKRNMSVIYKRGI